MQDYTKLDVWKKSHELALALHRAAARSTPADAAIADELCRAAVSIPVIIIFGCEGETQLYFLRALRGAGAAVDELAYLMRFARDAGVLDEVPYAKLEACANQLRAMLGGLTRTVLRAMGETQALPARTAGARGGRSARGGDSSPRGSRPRPTS